MNLSYWEYKSWFANVDFTIVGSGIVGLNCAINLKEKHPKATIIVLEKGSLPQGASTKNAGFACFGSISEILDDLNHHTKQEILTLIKTRINGLELLRNTLGDKNIDYQQFGGYELFTKEDTLLYNNCLEKLESINKLLKPIFNTNVFSLKLNAFRFKNIQNQYIFNPFEGQIDTGKMMLSLTHLAQQKGIKIINNCAVELFTDNNTSVNVKTNITSFKTNKMLIATNGFVQQLLAENVKPARAQVLITKPINKLHIKGIFHFNKGYYYFRNIDNRILFGGARNLDFKTEETTQFGQTSVIQNKLEELLKTTILPNTPFRVDYAWSGIMGVGKQKKPIVKQLSNNVFCGVRLGGMGIAIGSNVGKNLANLLS